MSHTPGPWKAVGNQVHVGRMRICSCVTAGEQLSIGESHDRACANAHLIAAAPDLLEACEMIATLYERNQDLSVHETALVAYDMRCLAIKALAKARGES